MIMSRQIPAPISEGSPYMPVITYTMACPMVMIIPNTARHNVGCVHVENRESIGLASLYSLNRLSVYSKLKWVLVWMMAFESERVAQKTYISELH